MELYALVGKPLAHSFSQKYFREKFSREGIEADYELWEENSVEEALKHIAATPELKGFNITMPYKKAFLPYLDYSDASAELCGNVNCVKVIRENGKTRLKGYNTDFYGFETSLEESFNLSAIKTAVILGSGGVSQTIAKVLEKHGISYRIASRRTFEDEVHISYAELDATLSYYRLIINATPLGMHPYEDCIPPIDTSELQASQCVFDLIYNPSQTLLLQQAAAKHCPTSNGLRMLTLQADKAWTIWRND